MYLRLLKNLQDQSGLDLTDIANVTRRLWQMATEKPPEKVNFSFPKSDAMCKKGKTYDGAELGKNLQAIRMADVKASTDCRTLTLQAEDFVELLLVV